jgi:hypothetical protein
VRNGGFPDWVRARVMYGSADPAFLALAEPLYREIARQLKALLWKDGGPVIGIQLDNENDDPPYLLALKKMARELGLDVPLYTMTGWNRVTIPKEGLLPLFGAYVIGFWAGPNLEDSRKAFMFSNIRDDGGLGAQMENLEPERNEHIESFPFACVEIGPGMVSSYHSRIKIDPDDAAAMAMVKLGCGNNMPGYYMYHGGVNPEGKLTTLQEEEPNAMPVKDYDFQTAIGNAGQIRKQFHLLREQNLFLHDYGPKLARMPAYFPDQSLRNLEDVDTLRWSVRADDKGSGFLFFNNRQHLPPMPEKKDVRFVLKTTHGLLTLPRARIAIPSGAYGIWPIRLDCHGLLLEYATVQPLCHLTGEQNDVTYFFTAIEGVRPELAFEGGSLLPVIPGTKPALTVRNAKGETISFVVLTPEQGLDFYRAHFAGSERAILSKATVLVEGSSLRLQTCSAASLELAMFPPVPAVVTASGDRVIPIQDGVFARFILPKAELQPINITAILAKPPGAMAASLKGTEEAAWKDAAIYKLTIPDIAAECRLLIDIHYTGDAARIYAGGKLILDHFYNGDPISLPLWRIAREDWPTVELRILPYSDALMGRLPAEAKNKIAAAKANGALDSLAITVHQCFDSLVTAP